MIQQDLIESLVRGYVRSSYRASKRNEPNSFYFIKSLKLRGILAQYVDAGLIEVEQLDRMIEIYNQKMAINEKV